MLRYVAVSEVGVPMAPTVQTGPDSEQQRVVPEAQALGSLLQVSLPLGPQIDTTHLKLISRPYAVDFSVLRACAQNL